MSKCGSMYLRCGTAWPE